MLHVLLLLAFSFSAVSADRRTWATSQATWTWPAHCLHEKRGGLSLSLSSFLSAEKVGTDPLLPFSLLSPSSQQRTPSGTSRTRTKSSLLTSQWPGDLESGRPFQRILREGGAGGSSGIPGSSDRPSGRPAFGFVSPLLEQATAVAADGRHRQSYWRGCMQFRGPLSTRNSPPVWRADGARSALLGCSRARRDTREETRNNLQLCLPAVVGASASNGQRSRQALSENLECTYSRPVCWTGSKAGGVEPARGSLVDTTSTSALFSSSLLHPVRGSQDFPPLLWRLHQWLFSQWRETAASFGFYEFATPVVEPAELYVHPSGERSARLRGDAGTVADGEAGQHAAKESSPEKRGCSSLRSVDFFSTSAPHPEVTDTADASRSDFGTQFIEGARPPSLTASPSSRQRTTWEVPPHLYLFRDQSERPLALRPELTPSLCRLLLRLYAKPQRRVSGVSPPPFRESASTKRTDESGGKPTSSDWDSNRENHDAEGCRVGAPTAAVRDPSRGESPRCNVESVSCTDSSGRGSRGRDEQSEEADARRNGRKHACSVAALESLVANPSLPVRLTSIGDCWRYERPGRCRRRQHWQWNLDIVLGPGEEELNALQPQPARRMHASGSATARGASDGARGGRDVCFQGRRSRHPEHLPDARPEAEVLAAAVSLLEKLGLRPKDVEIRVGSRRILEALLVRLGVIDGQKLWAQTRASPEDESEEVPEPKGMEQQAEAGKGRKALDASGVESEAGGASRDGRGRGEERREDADESPPQEGRSSVLHTRAEADGTAGSIQGVCVEGESGGNVEKVDKVGTPSSSSSRESQRSGLEGTEREKETQKVEQICQVLDRLERHSVEDVLPELSKVTGLGLDDARALVQSLQAFSPFDPIPTETRGQLSASESPSAGSVSASPESSPVAASLVDRQLAAAVEEVRQLFDLFPLYGLSHEWLSWHLLTVRGLGYYRGLVFEAFERVASSSSRAFEAESRAGAGVTTEDVDAFSKKHSGRKAETRSGSEEAVSPTGPFKPRALFGGGRYVKRVLQLPRCSTPPHSEARGKSQNRGEEQTTSVVSRRGGASLLRKQFLRTGISAVGLGMGDTVLLDLLDRKELLPDLRPAAVPLVDIVVGAFSSQGLGGRNPRDDALAAGESRSPVSLRGGRDAEPQSNARQSAPPLSGSPLSPFSTYSSQGVASALRGEADAASSGSSSSRDSAVQTDEKMKNETFFETRSAFAAHAAAVALAQMLRREHGWRVEVFWGDREEETEWQVAMARAVELGARAVVGVAFDEAERGGGDVQKDWEASSEEGRGEAREEAARTGDELFTGDREGIASPLEKRGKHLEATRDKWNEASHRDAGSRGVSGGEKSRVLNRNTTDSPAAALTATPEREPSSHQSLKQLQPERPLPPVLARRVQYCVKLLSSDPRGANGGERRDKVPVGDRGGECKAELPEAFSTSSDSRRQESGSLFLVTEDAAVVVDALKALAGTSTNR
ncbi:tRNA ligase class II core domain (G, H, P, S and T) domain-containing protein [Toxoplasma gondii ARI]|uniref:histidine--tRNA ligase n=1 Tax=Toxoplasma gondii ARI TaxID=1074872 RepID=A0A139XLK0_TOXGO|nr:tRNA ligase class II core domain (G, H, P, S and T) domain-containing protein [Toxoplasma gondii ARI]